MTKKEKKMFVRVEIMMVKFCYVIIRKIVIP